MVDPGSWPRWTSRAIKRRTVFYEVVAALRQLRVEADILERDAKPLNIWIRDWGCVERVSFRYAPDYAADLYTPKEIDRAQRALAQHLGIEFRQLPLVFDGGNIVHNGRVAIVTEKVLRDNRHLRRGEVERMICLLGFERVVFIPVEPGDEIGHSDGVCRFVNERVLLVNDYRSDPAAREYGKRLRKVLRAAKLDAELIPFPWFCRAGRLDGVPSAVGCYINFLQLAQGVVLPAFDGPYDDQAFALLRRLVGPRVVSVRANALAELGGVFNCISLTW